MPFQPAVGVGESPALRPHRRPGFDKRLAVAAKVFTSSGHERKPYVITGPEALTLQQVAEKLPSILGRKIEYVDVPLGAAADGMRKSGMPEWNVRVVTELLGYFASGAAATVTNAIPSLLGRPAISFEQFANDHRAAFGAEVQLHATSKQPTKTPAQVAL